MSLNFKTVQLKTSVNGFNYSVFLLPEIRKIVVELLLENDITYDVLHVTIQKIDNKLSLEYEYFLLEELDLLTQPLIITDMTKTTTYKCHTEIAEHLIIPDLLGTGIIKDKDFD